MPKPRSGRHTAESLAHVVARLREITAQIEAASAVMSVDPSMASLDILYEPSLVDGLKYLQIWADAARDAVRDAELAHLRNGRVSDSGTPPKPKPPKTHRK